ncbi:MAG: DNA-deoxyinosine glycosylase [Rhodospirillales bacterium]|nr:DNA-deoxyinosine glycosylase [Rhodospirillales bacterium]MCB9995312.1 DNA-deoxyinosine glycosylase [Rhodospirillales bacterium]
MAYTNLQTRGVEPQIHSFPAVSRRDAKILVLGSMPGKASLDAGQYYAHPRNLFWPIMGQLTGAIPELPYENRLVLLQKSGVALWDVLKSCTRHGSLDSNIENEVPNDMATFLAQHPHITRICFNGQKAQNVFERHFSGLKDGKLRFTPLPSTSPAHASMTYEQKLEAWKTILR